MTDRTGFDYDPEFPDRPLHPDFKLLSDLIVAWDKDVDVDATLTRMGGVDPDSLFYMAGNRAELAKKRMQAGGAELEVQRLAAAWIDGFLLSAQFTREKLFSLEDEVTKDGGRRTGEQ